MSDKRKVKGDMTMTAKQAHDYDHHDELMDTRNKPKQAHTPTGFELERFEENGEYDAFLIRVDRPHPDCVATIHQNDGEKLEDVEALGKFMVRACNSHHELLEALKEVTARYERLENLYTEKTGIVYDCQNGSIERAKEAITNAEAKGE